MTDSELTSYLRTKYFADPNVEEICDRLTELKMMQQHQEPQLENNEDCPHCAHVVCPKCGRYVVGTSLAMLEKGMNNILKLLEDKAAKT